MHKIFYQSCNWHSKMLVKISTMFGEIKICFHLWFDWHFSTLLNFTKIKNGLLLYHFLFHFRSKKLIVGGTNFICTTAICFNNLYHSELFNFVEGRGTSSRVGQYISPHATHMCLVLLLPWLPIRTLFTLLLPCYLAIYSLLLFTVLLLSSSCFDLSFTPSFGGNRGWFCDIPSTGNARVVQSKSLYSSNEFWA